MSSKTPQMLLACVLSLTAANSCGPKVDLSGLEEHLSEGGYVTYYPARSNWGPGTVLSADLTENRLKNVNEECIAIYDSLAPKSNRVTFANFTAKRNRDFSIGLDLLSKVLGKDNAAKLGLNSTNSEDLKIVFRFSEEDSIAGSAAFQNDGKPRRIRPACESKLKSLKASGQFDGRIFIVTRALRSAATYDLKNVSEFKANANLAISDKLGAKSGVNWKSDDKTELQLEDNKLYIGAARGGFKRLDKWLPSGLIAGGLYESAFSDVRIEGFDALK